jgi:cyclopropane fatty-acyl-phospholipid synthase-like methyltransferase
MSYKKIITHYEGCFEKHGDTPMGVDWTKEEQVDLRYQTMLEVANFREKSFDLNQKRSFLDFGCGLSHLYDYIVKKDIGHVDYHGLEISEKFYNESKKKFPENNYIFGDILEDGSVLKQSYDYIVMNGVFTEKRDLTYDEMFRYFSNMIATVYPFCKRGMAFNVMSKQVDWELDHLFHVPLDQMADFLTKNITRDFVIRNDYGLYEYTVYLYKFGNR